MKFQVFVSKEVNPDFLSRMIMKKLGTPYSHIGLLVTGTDCHLYHSTGKGFHRQSKEDFLSSGVKAIHASVDITPLVKDKKYALGFIHGRVGTEYSESQYIGFLLPWTQGFFANKNKKGICSEEVMYFLNKCVLGGSVDDIDYYDPKMAWDFVNQLIINEGK